jgi:hypothetical protein
MPLLLRTGLGMEYFCVMARSYRKGDKELTRSRQYSEYWWDIGILVPWFYIKKLAIALVVFLILRAIAGSHMLMTDDQIWPPDPAVGAGLLHAWWFFAWAVGLNLAFGLGAVLRREPCDSDPEMNLVHGVWTGFNAGFFEEVLWRWFIFLSAMVTLWFFNIVTFGLTKWVFTHLLIPVTDWVSFGALHAQLYSPIGWLLGAAIVSANMDFRDAHLNLAVLTGRYTSLYRTYTFSLPLGAINAWFGGLALFWLMFHYGIQTAIVAHILYDVCVDVTVYTMRKCRPHSWRW